MKGGGGRAKSSLKQVGKKNIIIEKIYNNLEGIIKSLQNKDQSHYKQTQIILDILRNQNLLIIFLLRRM